MRAASAGMILLFTSCNADSDGTNPGTVGDVDEQAPWDTSTPRDHRAGLTVVFDGLALGTGDRVDLGDAPVGAAAPVEATLVISNPGDAAADVDATLSGAGFSWLSAPPATLDPGASVPAVVGFLPPGDGPATGTLGIGDIELDLAGFGVPPPPFIGWGGNRVFRSTDYGETWSSVYLPSGHNIYGIASDGERLVLAGYVGDWSQGLVMMSDDFGLTWTEAFTSTRGTILDVEYGNDRFVLIGNFGNLAWSADGGFFFEEAYDYDTHLWNGAFGDGAFVAVGGTRRGVTWDGVAWESLGHFANETNDVKFGNGAFVALGPSGRVATSTDGGFTWTDQTVGSASHAGAFGDGRFVIGGWPDGVYTSTDGLDWTHQPSAEGSVPACYGAGWFIAGEWHQRIARSRDGLTWEQVKGDDSDTSLPGFGGCIYAGEAP